MQRLILEEVTRADGLEVGEDEVLTLAFGEQPSTSERNSFHRAVRSLEDQGLVETQYAEQKTSYKRWQIEACKGDKCEACRWNVKYVTAEDFGAVGWAEHGVHERRVPTIERVRRAGGQRLKLAGRFPPSLRVVFYLQQKEGPIGTTGLTWTKEQTTHMVAMLIREGVLNDQAKAREWLYAHGAEERPTTI